jgi:hypothetical protein
MNTLKTMVMAAVLVLLQACSLAAQAPDQNLAELPEAELISVLDTADPTAAAWPLHLYSTCGDPVCSGWTPDPNLPRCGWRQEGMPCRHPGKSCERPDFCNSKLMCTDRDPTQQPGGCPISRKEFKKDIDYLEPTEVQAVHDELVNIPLATWHYKDESDRDRVHMGFIIDDNPTSVAVAADGNHVDLYGYTSMTVAALQVQSQRIAQLERELAELKALVELSSSH